MDQLFTRTDAWAGGHFELDIELPNANRSTIKNALTLLWAHPALEGCYLQSDVEPANQQKVSPANSDHEGHWHGVAKLPNTKLSCCGTYWGDYHDNGCWVGFYLPLGSLGQAYPVGAYPFLQPTELSPELWIREIDTWLEGIARYIYQQLKFKVGLTGFEVDVFDKSLWQNDAISADRWEGILKPQNNELIWYPPTIYKPLYTLGKPLT